MKVKIKIGDEIIDAKIVMMNGNMIVSPKVEKFEPKDGDVVHCTNSSCSYVAIFRNISKCGTAFYRHAVLIDNEELKINTDGWDFSDYKNPRPATKEEKQKLFDRLKEEGWEWDAEKKELVKLKWKPKYGGRYYRPSFCYSGFYVYDNVFSEATEPTLKPYIDKGWLFKTEKECQAFCEKLNQTIEGVKP